MQKKIILQRKQRILNLAIIVTPIKNKNHKLLNEYFKIALADQSCDLEKLLLEFNAYVCLDVALYFLIKDENNSGLESDIEKILDHLQFPLSNFLKSFIALKHLI